jgi:Xaa-Pro aminopeptidase
MWSKEKISNHEKACILLDEIKDLAFEFIRNHPNTDEYEVQQFIHQEFKKNNLSMIHPHTDVIVAFNESSASPHYFPKKENSKKLTPNTLILIDIWARLNKKNSPFGDITWMAYFGMEIPEEIKEVWNIVKDARDFSIKFIQDEIKQGRFPTGKEVDNVARKIISDEGFKENILHNTGHSIGFHSPHGKEKGLSQKNQFSIIKDLGYTDEPGIYLKNKFGVRSEICFYINDNNEITITTPIQKELIHIIPE